VQKPFAFYSFLGIFLFAVCLKVFGACNQPWVTQCSSVAAVADT